MSSPDSEARTLEEDVLAAQKLFNGRTARILRVFYGVDRPVGFGELVSALDSAGSIPLATLTRQLLALEELGVIEVLTDRPPGRRRGVAVLYSLKRDRVDGLLDTYLRWIRGSAVEENEYD